MSEIEVEEITETETATELGEVVESSTFDQDLDELVDQYIREADAKEAQHRDIVMAAFEAGTLLRVVEPLELYDPIDAKAIRVRRGEVLTVASHEGDVLVGQLADNSHSLGVLYEEEHRWYQRKYFLPLALLTSREKIEIDPELEEPHEQSLAPVKGMSETAKDEKAVVAVRKIEELELRDEAAFLPRDVTLIFRDGVTAADAESGEPVELPPGTEAVTIEPVGDILDHYEEEIPPVKVRVGERELTIPFEKIADLDPDNDVLTLDNVAKRSAEELSRRGAMRRLAGVGIAGGMLLGSGGYYVAKRASDSRLDNAPEFTLDEDTTEPQARLNHQVVSAIVPQASMLYAYFTSGNQYWWELRGKMMDLSAQDAKPLLNAQTRMLQSVSADSSQLWELYKHVFLRRVHVGWAEHRQYRTDSNGRQRYVGSLWSKIHRTMWLEPQGLRGFHTTLSAWSNSDEHRYWRAHKLENHPLFDLLAADPENAEGTFKVEKEVVGFGRDAAVSMATMALMTLPPAFYDELTAMFSSYANTPNETGFGPKRGAIPYQKEAFNVAGLAAGVVLSTRYQRSLSKKMRESKYNLGRSVDEQVRRVPQYNFDAAFRTYFGQPTPEQLTQGLARRADTIRDMGRHLHSFTYTYGMGWDNGRRLDPVYVNPSQLARALPRQIREWPRYAVQLDRFLSDSGHRERILPVLKNAIGTETVEAQMKQAKGDAKGGSWKRSLWFALPLWGAVAADALLKGGVR